MVFDKKSSWLKVWAPRIRSEHKEIMHQERKRSSNFVLAVRTFILRPRSRLPSASQARGRQRERIGAGLVLLRLPVEARLERGGGRRPVLRGLGILAPRRLVDPWFASDSRAGRNRWGGTWIRISGGPGARFSGG